MKLTIDSTEPLNDALRAVGALYNVTLQVSGDAEEATSATDTTDKPSSTAATKARTANTRSPRKRRKGKRARTGTGDRTSNSAVRAWARENGYAVADRGRIPAEVVAAYRQSHNND